MKIQSSTIRTFIITLTCFMATGVHAEVSERVGYAYDKRTGEFLYSETHREVREGGRLVRNTVAYRGSDGTVFAEKYIDYQRSPTMPDFHLVNEDNGHVEGARGGDGQLAVHFRRDAEADVQEASVELPREGIIDAGFDRFIERNWDALVGGDSIERDFLIPSQLDFYTFEIGRVESAKLDEFSFELRVKSMFLQMFVSPVRVHYDARTRSLLRYEGISNIRDGDGKNFDVRIEFPGAVRVQVEAETGEPAS